MAHSVATLSDSDSIAENRAVLGANFARILHYFHQDGSAALGDLANGLRAGNAASMIDPAERLKSTALEIGARRLAGHAEAIEYDARDCVEWHQSPDLLLETVVSLHREFATLIEDLNRVNNPLVMRSAPSGRHGLSAARA